MGFNDEITLQGSINDVNSINYKAIITVTELIATRSPRRSTKCAGGPIFTQQRHL